MSVAALSLLLADNPEYDYHEIVLPFTESSSRYANPAKEKEKPENQSILKVYPNPSHNYITLEYRTADQYSNVWFTICDVNGKEIIKQQLLGGDNEEIINTTSLKPDVYTIILYGDKNIIATEKITVMK